MEEVTDPHWQPILKGPTCALRPLRSGDFDALFDAASDPDVWEQHPVRDRYKREKFTSFFDGGLKSKGALAIVHGATGKVIGTSRFADHDPAARTVEIGYTFMAKPWWGTGLNAEVKALMLAHALNKVERVFFYVGESNFRSQRALSNLGIRRTEATRIDEVDGRLVTYVIFEVDQDLWTALSRRGAPLGMEWDGPRPSRRFD